MDCGYRCHEIGGPYIAENPDCPIHGAGGIGDDLEKMDDMKSAIRDLCELLEGYVDAEHLRAFEVIERGRALL